MKTKIHSTDRITRLFTQDFLMTNLLFRCNKDGKPMLETMHSNVLLHLIYLFVKLIFHENYLHFLSLLPHI